MAEDDSVEVDESEDQVSSSRESASRLQHSTTGASQGCGRGSHLCRVRRRLSW